MTNTLTIQDRINKQIDKITFEMDCSEGESNVWNKKLKELFSESIKEVEEETRKEIINEAVKIIESHIPTDNMGDYGGDGALSDNEIAEMFIDEIIPELEDLSITNKEKQK